MPSAPKQPSLPHHTELGPGGRFPVVPFFALIFVSWALWIPAGARHAGALPFPWPFELAFLGVFSPLIFAIVFTARAGGRAGLARFFGRFVHWRFPPLYWAYAVLAMPLAALGAAGVLDVVSDEHTFAHGLERLLDGAAMDAVLQRQQGIIYESVGPGDALTSWQLTGPIAFALGFLGLTLLDGGVSEEPGWRAYAYAVLRDRWAALPAALVVGAVWALWHIGPLQWAILFEEGTSGFLAFLPGHLMLYVVGVLPLAIIFSWLYEATRGSLLVCFVVHASFNITSTMSRAMFDGPVILGVIAILWASAITILVRHGWRSFGMTGRAGAASPRPSP